MGARATVWEAVDKPALKPLPTEPFDLSEWSRARVNIDYHVAFDANLYSVPYNLVHELVEIRSTPTTVEILHKGTRVASHLRSRGRGQAITNEEHRPKSHRAHLEWTPSRMVHWAETIGPNTARLFERIMNDKPHPEMGYRGCLGIIRLAEKYSAQRVEAASERALLTGACRYKSVESILKNSLDQVPPVFTAARFHPAARQHPRFGILRVGGPHATRTDDGKTDGHAAAGHGGRPESAGARSGGARAEFPGTARPAGGSAVDLARESGSGAALACRQAEGRLRGRDRLSHFAGTGQERDPRAGAEVGLGRSITKTSSCSGPPASARASWLARWRRRPAAMDTRRSIRAPPRCSAIWPWHAPMEVCAVCWRV